MIYNKFINCQTLEIFKASLDSGEIVDQHIVFIEDVKQIWTNGIYYAANEFDQADLEKLTRLADVLVMDGDGTKVLSDKGTYVTMPIFSEAESMALINLTKIIITDGDGTKVLANNGKYVSMPDLSTSDITSVKNLLSIIQLDGDGTKVLANNGEYIEANKLGNITAGSETKHVYLKEGSIVASSTTIGSATKPVYMNKGSITECGDSLEVSITGNATSASSVTWTNVTDKPSSFTPASHTHQYAGSSSAGGSATSAAQLDTESMGNTTKPVYFSGGKPVECTAYASASVMHASTADYVTRSRGSNTVTTLTNLPITKDTIVATLSAATTISLSDAMNVGESLTVICTPSASFTQPIPTSGDYMSMDGDSLNIVSGKVFELNIYCYASGKYSISSKIAK